MHTIRLLSLFLLVLFGAFMDHQAGNTVKEMRAKEKKLMQYKNDIEAQDVDLIKRAMELSHVALIDGHGHPFGSVVTKEGEIVGEGWNKTKLLNDPSAHAEVEAIRDACKSLSTTNLKGCVIYTSSQPCPMCLSLIYIAGIEKIFYCIPGEAIQALDPTLSVEQLYRELAKPSLERMIPEISVAPEEVNKTISLYKAHYSQTF